MTDTQDFSDWIGKPHVLGRDLVTQRLIDGFRATIPLTSQHEEVPVGLHWCLCPEAVPPQGLNTEGHARLGSFMPETGLPSRMWAGGEVHHHAPLRLGDEVTKTATIQSVVQKQGTSGALVFVTVENVFSTSRGAAITDLQTIVYRAAHSGPPRTITPSKEQLSQLARVDVDEITLFGYSGLTFNSHRIHFDLKYTTETEGYRDLVIHGPLQATLLLGHAARIAGKTPNHFSYRGIAPATGAQTLNIGVVESGATTKLAVHDAEGVQTMIATARS